MILPNPWLVLGSVLACLGAAVGGYSFGVHSEKNEQAALQKALLERAAEKTIALQSEIDNLSFDLDKAQRLADQKAKTVFKEVIKYRESTERTSRCTLSPAWGVLHDMSATGSYSPGTTVNIDGAAVGVDDAVAIETVTSNYGQCRFWADQVRGWQEYCRKIGCDKKQLPN